jgi:hypothetical protein
MYIPGMKPYMRSDESPRGIELPMKRPICVEPTHPWYKCDQMSRINRIGRVVGKHHYLLEASFSETFFPRTQMSTFPMSQSGYAPQQSDFAGIGAHSQHQISGEQNTSLDDGLPLNQSYFSTSANPPTTDPVGTYCDDQATGKDRETGERYSAPEYGPPYATQQQTQYYSPSTDPFTTGYSEASHTPQGPIGPSQGQFDSSYGPSPPPSGPIGPPQDQYHDSYGPSPTPHGPIAPTQAQYHDSYSPSPSYGGQKRQSRYHKGRKG